MGLYFFKIKSLKCFKLRKPCRIYLCYNLQRQRRHLLNSQFCTDIKQVKIRMEKKVELLLTITGEDQPGITADICYELSKANADLLDIQQVTISPLLVMALHVGLPIPPGEIATEPAAFVPGELLRLALRRNLQLRVQPFVPSPEPKSPDLHY